MILAGDLLDRRDFTDAGLFHLEGLAAHFQRRGLLSEYTSPTYTLSSATGTGKPPPPVAPPPEPTPSTLPRHSAFSTPTCGMLRAIR
jgi:hypothetical protein